MNAKKEHECMEEEEKSIVLDSRDESQQSMKLK